MTALTYILEKTATFELIRNHRGKRFWCSLSG